MYASNNESERNTRYEMLCKFNQENNFPLYIYKFDAQRILLNDGDDLYIETSESYYFDNEKKKEIEIEISSKSIFSNDNSVFFCGFSTFFEEEKKKKKQEKQKKIFLEHFWEISKSYETEESDEENSYKIYDERYGSYFEKGKIRKYIDPGFFLVFFPSKNHFFHHFDFLYLNQKNNVLQSFEESPQIFFDLWCPEDHSFYPLSIRDNIFTFLLCLNYKKNEKNENFFYKLPKMLFFRLISRFFCFPNYRLLKMFQYFDPLNDFTLLHQILIYSLKNQPFYSSSTLLFLEQMINCERSHYTLSLISILENNSDPVFFFKFIYFLYIISFFFSQENRGEGGRCYFFKYPSQKRE